MRLIRRVHIEGFRSIRRGVVETDGPFTTLVGKNSSGKSNVLRALNLFFNNVVENGKPVVFGRDYHEQPASKRKKVIAVTVDFAVPSTIRFRRELTALSAVGPRFTVTRSWNLDERRQPVDALSMTAAGAPVANGAHLARQFLNLISYRYVPNRSIPAELLTEESQALAQSILIRLKGDTHAQELVGAFGKAASSLLKNVQESFESTGAPLSKATIATSSSVADMLRMSGFQASTPSGATVRDEDWGAGHQAFFLYLILHALDTDYGRFFGWRQGTVWGIEEPESGLHRDLETRLADRLRTWSMDQQSRLQVLATTHSATMVMASHSGQWFEMNNTETLTSGSSIPHLVRAAEVAGVSGFVHPILAFPWNPVVLVEGPSDAAVLSHVASLAGYDHLRFLPLPALDASEPAGGKDSISTYLKRHGSLLVNRPRNSPLIVLLDWEVRPDNLASVRRAYGSGGDTYVVQADAAHADPVVGPDFVGIERFYPPSVVLDAHTKGELVLGIQPGKPYSIATSQLSVGKNRLRERVLKLDDLVELRPLIHILKDLEEVASTTRPKEEELFGKFADVG